MYVNMKPYSNLPSPPQYRTGTRNSDLVCIHSACGRVSPSIDCNVTRNRSIATRAMDGAPRGGLTRLTMECTTKQRFPMAKEIFSMSYMYYKRPCNRLLYMRTEEIFTPCKEASRSGGHRGFEAQFKLIS